MRPAPRSATGTKRCQSMEMPLLLEDLLVLRAAWREQGMVVAFTNGCFDLLHAGHVRYLNEVKSMADIFVVGLNSDVSVRLLKGEDRPVTPQEERAEILLALKAVSAVIVFDEPTPRTLIEALEPDLLAKGGDWREENIVGADFVKSRGGRIVVVPVLPERSSSGLITSAQRKKI